jgi:gliding motility-associated-like protein
VLYIYNQWGELIYTSDQGYPQAWDGKRNGVNVPVSAYYYVLELNESGHDAMSGHITVIR